MEGIPCGTEASTLSWDPVRVLVDQGLDELGIPAAEKPLLLDGLVRLNELVSAWSRRINLTAYGTPEAIARRLVLDAVALGLILPEGASLVDLGSGAGFPGLPIALLRPRLRVTLVESRIRRHHFQLHAIRSLRVANAIAVLGRAEKLEPWPHDLAVAQAAGRPGKILPWAVRWVAPGGWVLIPGRSALSLSHPHPPPEVRSVEIRRYRVPLGGPQHVVWIGQRESAC